MNELRQMTYNRRIAAGFLDLEQHCAYMAKVELDQVVYRRTNESWLCVLKGSRQGLALVSFVEGKSYKDTVALTGELADAGHLVWQVDRWPSKRLAKALSLK